MYSCNDYKSFFAAVSSSVLLFVITGVNVVGTVEAAVNNHTGNQAIQRTNQVQQFNSLHADVSAEKTSKPRKCLLSMMEVKHKKEINGFDSNKYKAFLNCFLVLSLS